METSILKSTKKILGMDADYTAFDLDIITFINSVFSSLKQLGIGPTPTIQIEDDTAVWDDVVTNPEQQSMIKTYVYLSVRLAFDPPATSFGIDALEKQILEHQWRLNVMREETAWEEGAGV